ncbi:TetR/AcrR family transcriptional regulator [Gellertiella hungarica]|uniref:AcrR family transcriptional regulator n=1 Tax=Gellertiella hungarica TaxID=1572859 RepID=A0A7W6J5Z8_9HYPH|nr:TetR/AcrR family transcriptional regulator [Gellertiella hungarica]MBB4065416.1 AcrR family transcriptional regulator [Gellertiella hungarica]
MDRTTTTGNNPRRPDLSRDNLVDAAIGLIDRDGAGALSIRALADAVGVTPMALYNHFSSKRDLIAAVGERLIRSTQFDGGHGDWREQLRYCFGALRHLCLRHPGLPDLLKLDGVVPEAAYAPMDVTKKALQAQGMSELDSVRTFFLLTGYTLSQAAFQSHPTPALAPTEKVRRERISGRGHGPVDRRDPPPEWDFDASFSFGLGIILEGIEGRIRAR